MKLHKTFALATLLLTFVAGSSAWAQCKPFSAKIALEPTKLGGSLGAIGTVIAQSDWKCNEMFGLTVSAKLEDGEMLTVVVVSKSGTFRIGGVKMFSTVGQLVLDSTQDVSDVFPVTELVSIQVIQTPITKTPTKIAARLEAPRVLLEGAF